MTTLMVKPGTCLGWYVSEEAAEVSSVELRPFQHPWILPTGREDIGVDVEIMLMYHRGMEYRLIYSRTTVDIDCVLGRGFPR